MISPYAYFDENLFEEELETLFRNGPGYVGHALTVPNIGDYSALRHEDEGRMLVHGEGGIELISNICRHRQAIMLKGAGKIKHITCPLHKWSWDLRGEMTGAPHFRENPCKHLHKWTLQNWRGLLFSGKRDIAKDLEKVGYTEDMNFDNYRYHHTEYHECDYNWKSFMEVYGDDYHVVPFHPGLSKMVSMKKLDLDFGEDWHVQVVGPTEILDTKTTPIYEAWREKCLKQGDGKLPKYGAIWFAYYPNIMVEVYPYTITVSTLHPISPTKTMNVVEFFYHHDVDKDLIEAEQRAYMETAIEDDELAERMDSGREVLMKNAKKWGLMDDELAGPCHPHLEAGTEHFMEWWREKMSL